LSVLKLNPVKSLPFTQHLGFRKTLNQRIDAYMREHNLKPHDVPAMYVKTAVVMAWWLVTYLLLLLGGFPPLLEAVLCVVWALAIASIGFNVMHDANHSSYSRYPRVNKLIGLSSEMMLGMSGFRWRTKHNVWHHTYTNIAGLDDDVETYGTMRLSPHSPWKPLHRLQAWYFPLIYGFIGFDFIVRDFLMVFFGKSDANHVYPAMTRADRVIFWVGKVLFFTIMIMLPLLTHPWWQVLLGFVLVMLTAGIVLGIVFQLAHVVEEATFPEPIGNPLHIENEWAIHQVQTTADFAPRNTLLNLYVGGLNYQVEHHLLPHICHIHYPKLAPIVKQTCEEFGIRYNCFPTWRAAFASHVHSLREMGQAQAAA
jgi:linoleoyl-CoA desaturase